MNATQKRAATRVKPAARLRKPERKRQLLDHARQLFARFGYTETTTEKIARAAEVSEAVLYRHFESKKALFLEVLQQVREDALRLWGAVADGLADPVAKLHAVAETCFDASSDLASDLRLAHRALLETDDPDIRAALRAFYLDCETFLAQIVSEGQQAGVFRRSMDPRIGAWDLIRTALGHSLTLPLDVPLYDEPDYVPRAVECLLHGLLKTDV